ncbi:hypothetical protein ACTFIW_006065 [Dictyostelium discoideum]
MFVSYSFFKYTNYYFYYKERLTKRISHSKNNLIFQRSSHISNKLEDTIEEKATEEKAEEKEMPTYLNPRSEESIMIFQRKNVSSRNMISEWNKVFNFPSNFQVNVAPFGTPEGISVSSTVKNNDTDLLIIEKRINDSLKHLLLISSMVSSDSSNVDVELISSLAQSVLVLSANDQASLSRVRRNNVAKEIYGPEVLLPTKIKKYNEGNSSNSKSSSGSNGPSSNFNGLPSNVVSGSNNTKSLNGTNNGFQKNKNTSTFKLKADTKPNSLTNSINCFSRIRYQSLPILQNVNSEISLCLSVLNQWNGKEISLFPSYDNVPSFLIGGIVSIQLSIENFHFLAKDQWLDDY